MRGARSASRIYFYSRPCGRGDVSDCFTYHSADNFYSRPCGRGDAF